MLRIIMVTKYLYKMWWDVRENFISLDSDGVLSSTLCDVLKNLQKKCMLAQFVFHFRFWTTCIS